VPPLPQPQRDAALAAVNGILGDYLTRTANPLAIPMQLRRYGGQTLPLTRRALARELPRATDKLLVAVHGLCMSDGQWTRREHNHAERLAAAHGLTPVYLWYNSGQHVSENGRAFAALLESLVAQWPLPVTEITLLAHSMGGLVARSAQHYGVQAGQHWPAQLRRMIFLGTPHQGAPLERGGNWLQHSLGVSPYTASLARLGMLRSAGITDLRHGSVLDEDWLCGDRFELAGAPCTPLPLPVGVDCFVAAASLSGPSARVRLLGDGLVPVASALGQHAEQERALQIPRTHRWVGRERNHWDLLSDAVLFERLCRWYARGARQR
jgi:pimeloyl-ACP methyl ester carboxylesterase